MTDKMKPTNTDLQQNQSQALKHEPSDVEENLQKAVHSLPLQNPTGQHESYIATNSLQYVETQRSQSPVVKPEPSKPGLSIQQPSTGILSTYLQWYRTGYETCIS